MDLQFKSTPPTGLDMGLMMHIFLDPGNPRVWIGTICSRAVNPYSTVEELAHNLVDLPIRELARLFEKALNNLEEVADKAEHENIEGETCSVCGTACGSYERREALRRANAEEDHEVANKFESIMGDWFPGQDQQ